MEITFFYILVGLGVFLSSCSQILLKKSAQKEHSSMITEMLNKQVIFAYSVFVVSVVINIVALANGVNVKDLPILEALGYIFVPLLSFTLLHEAINRRTLSAIALIISGIIIFYL